MPMMKPVRQIPMQEWMTAPETRAVMAALQGEQPGAVPNALFVGGCVRNALLGEAVSDIDIATPRTPDQVTACLGAAGIKAIPTGIDHGTVTAVTEGKAFEITTLRRDVETFGRHAVVAYTDDWAEDARRRDFTMNTLLADDQGHVYDPTGQGLADLEARRVVFVGDPARRIAEDYLRILRFFRFHAYYGAGTPDAVALNACRAAADHIGSLSRERITQEFLKILAVDAPKGILGIMFENNVMKDIFHPDYKPEILERLCVLQGQYEAADIIPRLMVVTGFDSGFFGAMEKYLLLSNARKKEGVALFDILEQSGDVKHLIYRYGAALTGQALLLRAARTGENAPLTAAMECVKNWQPPAFPLTGADVMAAGIAQGPAIGEILSTIENWWIEQDFKLGRAECVSELQRLTRR
ncbi:MAG: CCA tRNA nucleotidyltransferase [Rhodospirillales bacterium]|nr:CCA tRNA nucleotidyltransferase [Rhodospirillales bacterium]